MNPITTQQVREIIQGYCTTSKHRISHGMLYEMLGISSEPEKARARTRLNDLVRRQEIERVEPGVFRVRKLAAPVKQGECYIRIWRAIRASKPGWDYYKIVQVARVNYTTLRRYCGWLKEEGYIAPHGRTGNVLQFKATPKARQQRETPFPPSGNKDPFEAERNAACRLVRRLMEADPYQPAIREKIVKEANTILARFGQAEGETPYGD